MTRNIPLRSRLLLLALVGIIPLAAMSGIGLFALARQQQTQAEQAGLDVTRALATAVDGTLSEAESVLQVLASSVLLDAGSPTRFRERAQRVMRSQPTWIQIHLADPQGNGVVNTAYPDSRLPPAVTERESFEAVIRTGKPVIGYLSRGPEGNWGIPVRVPVVRNGKLRFVLSGVLKPDAIVTVVDRQQVPENWVVSVFDARNLRVARSRAHEKFIGMPPHESLQKLMDGGAREGTGQTTVLEGDRVFTAYTRSEQSNWTVAIGIPLPSIESGAYRSVATYGGGVLLSLAFAIGAALLIARGINRPIGELADSAGALGTDEVMTMPATDIREIRELASALWASAADAKEARQQAETASRTKDEFLAMLGHELRNPLAPIVTALRLMQMRAPGMPDREREIIERQVGHLSRLVDDLLDISRITRGKIELQRSRIDVNKVVRNAMEMAHPALEKRTQPPELDLPAVPLHVIGDATRLTQVLCNLIVNAARYTPDDARIAVRVSDAGPEVAIEVRDWGGGIPPELMPHLFEPFIQGKQAIDRRAGGLGLGLAIVKALVDLHGGKVTARSDGNGSTFLVTLPKGGTVTQAASTETESPKPADRASRILVVDDNADGADMLSVLLKMSGFEVRTAADADGALRIIREWQPALALLDIGLPGKDGFQLAAEIRADSKTGHMKLVALTGYGRDVDQQRALEAGFDVHLTKPAEPRQLLECVAELLQEQKP